MKISIATESEKRRILGSLRTLIYAVVFYIIIAPCLILLFDNNNKTKQPKHYQEEQAKKRFNGTDELRKLKCEQAVCPNFCKTEMCECTYENNKGNYEYIKCENIK